MEVYFRRSGCIVTIERLFFHSRLMLHQIILIKIRLKASTLRKVKLKKCIVGRPGYLPWLRTLSVSSFGSSLQYQNYIFKLACQNGHGMLECFPVPPKYQCMVGSEKGSMYLIFFFFFFFFFLGYKVNLKS